jgi:dTMP kinase
MNNPTQRPLFIVFEGLDGSGKSTCAKALAAEIGAVYLTTPSPDLRKHRDEIVRSFGTSQEAAQLFYLSTVFAASVQARLLIAEGKSVVMDRYFMSTQAYANFRGSQLGMDDLQSQLFPADITVYLETSLEVRKQRLNDRHCTSADTETLNEHAHAALTALHRHRSNLTIVGKWLAINNSGLSIESSIELLKIAIKSAWNCPGKRIDDFVTGK